MDDEQSKEKKGAAENFGDMLKEFGSAVAEIFNDPELKAKAKDFGESAKASAKAFAQRFKDEEVKSKFKDVGSAAKDFGESVSDYFKSDTKTKNPDQNTDKEQKSQDSSSNNFDEEKKYNSEEQDKKTDSQQIVEKKNEFAGFDSYFKTPRAGRLTGYIFSIFFGAAWLIFVTSFSRYIAFYSPEYFEGVKSAIYPVLTSEFSYWLPFFIISMGVSIAGNIFLIFYERYYLVKIISIISNLFSLAAASTLLKMFPFDFSLIPYPEFSMIAPVITTVVLIIIIIGTSIGTLIDFIKLVVFIAKSGSLKY